MTQTAKITVLMILIAIQTIGISACRTADDDKTVVSSDGVNQSQRAESPALPFSWSEISRNYEDLKDYTAIYEKEEKMISGGEKQTIKISFRKPFDVRLDWIDGKGKIDQTAIYQKGKNDDFILARKSGFLGLLIGATKIKPNSEIALQDSKHPINEVGLGNLLAHIISEATNPQTKTRYLGEELTEDGRSAYKIELVNQNGLNITGETDARKALVLIDKKLYLPVKTEIYDDNKVLLERHVFKNVALNVSLTDKTFEM